ncbi:MAG: hypothetical protein RBG13Loki_3825 [Promethearchaeota archaeon CR_4]|nr:MAG: hypothetical protein RBG13Loki_3825 [Candidatus Lokiarchaeota archaeon CR_4]
MPFIKDPLPFRNNNDILYANFINIGQGDCILFEIPVDGKYRYLLVDTGLREYERITAFKKNFGIPQIDYALITHPHDDHDSNIKAILDDNPRLNLWMPRCYNIRHNAFKNLFVFYFDRLIFLDWIGTAPVNLTPELSPSTKIELIGPTRTYIDELKENEIIVEDTFEINTVNGVKRLNNFIFGELDNDQENELSLILKISFCGVSIFIAGDAETHELDTVGSILFSEEEKRKNSTHIDIIKLNHHGSENAIPYILVGKTSSQYAIVTTFANVDQKKSVKFAKDTLGVEEYYRVGHTEHKNLAYINRDSVTFAIKPDKSGKKAVIVPMIYKLPTQTTGEIFFIRPSDVESR